MAAPLIARAPNVPVPDGYGWHRYVCTWCGHLRYLCLPLDAAQRPTETRLGCRMCGPDRLFRPHAADLEAAPETGAAARALATLTADLATLADRWASTADSFWPYSPGIARTLQTQAEEIRLTLARYEANRA